VAAKVAEALGQTTTLDAQWSDKIQPDLPGTLEEIIESHGVVCPAPARRVARSAGPARRRRVRSRASALTQRGAPHRPQVKMVPIEAAGSEWHHDLSVVSRIAEPPRVLAATRPSQGNSDYGFMFDVQVKSAPAPGK
jgi:hypothetical protein